MFMIPFLNMVFVSLAGVLLLLEFSVGCPDDIIKKAQDCFADLASGVTQTDKLAISGNLPLDYFKIREYCEKDGHMSKFLVCVDTLLEKCKNQNGSEILHQLINPDKVRSSVPHLCENIEEIEANADCMNKQMNKPSDCKMAAYDLIRNGMAETTGNVSAMFHIQCRFFSVLAECQRTAVSDNCGRKLGDLHANFLLSFVPNTCAGEGLTDILLPQLKSGEIYNLNKKSKEGGDGRERPELRNIRLKDKLPSFEKEKEGKEGNSPNTSHDRGTELEKSSGRASRSKDGDFKKEHSENFASITTPNLGILSFVYFFYSFFFM